MDQFYFSVNLDGDWKLCLAPLTDRRLAMVGEEVPDTSGYFLFEQRGSGDYAAIEIIAHVASEAAAERLRAMLNMA